MEQLSDNNFDALFQKAAEEYPLNTNNKNWDAVAAKLNKPAPMPVVKNDWWQYAAALLLLLMTGGFILYHYYNNSASSNVSKADNSVVKPSATKSVPQQQTKISTNKNNQQQTAVAATNNVQSNLQKQSSNNNQTINKQQAIKYNAPVSNNNIVFNNNTVNNETIFAEKNKMPVQAQSNLSQTENTNAVENKTNLIKQDKPASNNNTAAQNDINKNKAQNNVQNTASQHIKIRPQPKAFYGELFFAPNFSTVKMQRVNKPDYNVGVALGYRINRRFSAEIGLERLHSDFFTIGKYINTSNLKLKPNTEIQSVDGTSKLTEIPLNLKYNFSKNNEHFFASAGVVAARITHFEKYNYHATKDGSPREISRHFGALTGTKFFSDVNLSAGYQTVLSKTFSLKAEPYYQIPLKGLGVGKLPVTNFGINIGIVKDLR